ncbi:replication protein A 70 kDa DNA-binding subunit-like isoform X2 [Adelges cooleyi]|uniref:replication protein A 70 kDa DNA-binding subunit-like isoform X2 n=1 Tax=Adelges cooleyi TaxID=133065 RepID=UPI00218057B6|nr:replication protein A 70 kDa DNA-binding subunit-like isoform X2 [Adelges cooleyi]
MAIELTTNSIEKLCSGIAVQNAVVQLLGYELVNCRSHKLYRLVLSDGVYMNSYFYLCIQLNYLLIENKVKYGTILRIDEYKFNDGENCMNRSPRQLLLIEKVSILVHRNAIGNPLPLINILKKKPMLINLNLNKSPSRAFNSFEQLENNLRFVKELNDATNGKCSFVLKLLVIRKYPINTYNHCQVLNMNMEDYSGMIRVSAFNSLSTIMDAIFQENKMYFITDTVLKKNAGKFELKLQSYSVVIECPEKTTAEGLPTNISTFDTLLTNNPNTFCDLIGVCIEIGDIEVCNNTTERTEVAKRDIVLIDKSMRTVTLKVWGENVNKFNNENKTHPVVLVKQAILKQFNGVKHFTMQKASTLLINPNTIEARQIKEWYNSLGSIEGT